MQDATSLPTTFKAAVARQFAYRPTLRYVLSQEIHKVLVKHHPDQATASIDHDLAEPYTLIRPGLDGKRHPEALLSLLLSVFVQGQKVAFGVRDSLRLEAFGRAALEDFFEQVTGIDADDDSLTELSLAPMNDDLDTVLQSLIPTFLQAHIRFWEQDDAIVPAITTVSRHGWMRQALRSTLLRSVARSGWRDEERDCLYEVMLGLQKGTSVSAIELTFTQDGTSFSQLLPDLLIEAEREERELIVRCQPGGRVQAFESISAFMASLHAELAPRLLFDELAWQRRTFDADPFLQQSALLLSSLLADVERLQLSDITDAEQLEQTLALLTDPSRMFYSDDLFTADAPTAGVPAWLAAASTQDRFEYQVAMQDLAIAQALSRGKTSLDGVEDLHAFTVRRLIEQMSLDHPQDPELAPDELLIHVSVPDPVIDKELPVVLKPVGGKTLVAYAVERLDGLQDALITSVDHRDGRPIPGWMTPVYVAGLVEAVDIGGTYPAYVADRLNDPGQQAVRIERFSREWRSALLFDALRAKVDGELDGACWRALAEFCRSDKDLKANVDLAPLAFKAEPDSRQRDAAMCMYVIRLHTPKAVLLYRPLYPQRTLLSFADEATLMTAISAVGDLQDSVLRWLPESAFNVYARGGFLEPHLRRVIFDTSIWPEPVEPASLSLVPFLADIDTWMYGDKRQALIALAQRETLSNTQQRWSTLKRFGWLLFDLIAPVLPGSLGKVAWVASLLAPLLEPEQAPRVEGADSAFAIDLAANLAMALLHERLPDTRQGVALPAPAPVRLVEPALREPLRLPQVVGQVRHEPLDKALSEWSGQVSLGHGWGAGPVEQRAMLRPYRASVDLSGVAPGNDLYLLGGRFYAAVLGDHYQVVHEDEGRRIVGPAGELGPWLFHDGVWRVRSDGFALGGGPKQARGAQVTQAAFDRISARLDELIETYNRMSRESNVMDARELNSRAELDKVQALRDKAAANESGLSQEVLDRMLGLYDDNIRAKRKVFEDARSDYVAQMEAMVEIDLKVVDDAHKMLDMQRYRRVNSGLGPEELRRSLVFAREAIVRGCWFNLPRLGEMIDYPRISEMGQALHGRIVSDVPEQYEAFRQRMRETIPLQERMIRASALVDQFLPQVDPQAPLVAVVDGPPRVLFGELAAQRALTTVDIRFQQAVHYCELAIHYEMEDPTGQLPRYRQALMSVHLRAAAFAHGEVQFGSLSAADRVEALQSAWDEYSAAIINAVDIKRDGGSLVDVAMLDRYVEVMQSLKQDAGDRLVEAIGVEDGEPAQMGVAYDPGARVRAVARRSDGQIVVGDVVEEGGRRSMEVRDPGTRSRIVRFEQVGQAWVEVVERAAPELAPVRDELLRQALTVTAEDASVMGMADEYVAKRVHHRLLERLVDEHVSKLQKLADAFGDNTGATALLLKNKLAQWPARRESLLLTLHTETRSPDFESLRFLSERNLIKVEYRPNRKLLKDRTALDEYAIRLLKGKEAKSEKILWAVHYHYNGQSDPADDFVLAHIKTWAQRHYGREDAKRLAADGERIHRGPLTREQAKEIIAWAGRSNG
ncbi:MULTISPECIES: DUF6543 domain-containing protein [unclassified Pseudomonas]|uniref:dermonecrotic toxin domain-containing protein n=1 Tax=unclassified Pseudomonas TaxID=196821 RepID=UPI00244A4C17|nr:MULTISPECIES: DUF6543 domain-containing protein [unclassified Pseudomonas]MDH0304180.1 hypothetical protein [Pseudomonas sp. GD04091]MDH1986217.1 hypothetical protein [Pseudomonas sp. GD03689]